MDNNLHGDLGGEPGNQFRLFDDLSKSFGVDITIIKFFISILAGYLLAFIFLLFPKGNRLLNHAYFATCGLSMAYFCFGSECIYHMISILVSYISFNILGTGFYNMAFTFIFQMMYLVCAYVFYASAGYDFNWTTPQCLLCLKLIGLAWDCYDGHQKKEKLRPYQLETCYDRVPTLLEMLGFSYFFGSFLTGPAVPFTHYIKLADGTLIDKNADHVARVYAAVEKLFAAGFALFIYMYFGPKFSCEYFFTSEFKEQSFFMKCTLMMLTYHINFCKYVFSWMFAESICIVIGLGYNGTKDGRSKWDALTNFKYILFMFGAFFQDVLEGFNIMTSTWCGKYVFRRLSFLGNKTLSHVTTMAFLAVWHGFYVGYIILFAIEFCLLVAERELCKNLNILSGKSYVELSFPLRLVIRVLGFTYRAYICGFAATAFILLTWRRVITVYSTVYYWGFVAILLEVLVILVTNQLVRAKRGKLVEKKKEN